jgi:hypothetical protein
MLRFITLFLALAAAFSTFAHPTEGLHGRAPLAKVVTKCSNGNTVALTFVSLCSFPGVLYRDSNHRMMVRTSTCKSNSMRCGLEINPTLQQICHREDFECGQSQRNILFQCVDPFILRNFADYILQDGQNCTPAPRSRRQVADIFRSRGLHL